MTKEPVGDIIRILVSVLFVGILIASSVWILRPFLTSLIWAAIIVLSTWPILLKMQRRLWGKRGLAVAGMTLILLLVVVAPLIAAVASIIYRSGEIITGIKSLSAIAIQQPPDWISNLPLIGSRVAERWQYYAALGSQELSDVVAPYARAAINWFLSHAGGVAAIMLQFLLTVILSAVLYSGGEKAAAWVLEFARRVAGLQGEKIAMLAARAVRGVALGIVVTALIQTAIAGLGLIICGMPAAMLLTSVIFILCIAQVGPLPVLVPSIIWLYWKSEPVWGAVLIIFSIITVTIDNLVRPFLIRRGADMPLIMVFAGVIGGLIAFGVIGLFIGPVVLAVTHTILKVWVSGDLQDDRQSNHK